jgi:hypothetical protein
MLTNNEHLPAAAVEPTSGDYRCRCVAMGGEAQERDVAARFPKPDEESITLRAYNPGVQKATAFPHVHPCRRA